MAVGGGMHDQALSANLSVQVGRGGADVSADGAGGPPSGMGVVVLPVTVTIRMTPELQARLSRRAE